MKTTPKERNAYRNLFTSAVTCGEGFAKTDQAMIADLCDDVDDLESALDGIVGVDLYHGNWKPILDQKMQAARDVLAKGVK